MESEDEEEKNKISQPQNVESGKPYGKLKGSPASQHKFLGRTTRQQHKEKVHKQRRALLTVPSETSLLDLDQPMSPASRGRRGY
jgi:hypothetical protein